MKRWLNLKGWFVLLLIKLKLIPEYWYDCEIKLAKIRGKEYADFFQKTPPHFSKTVDKHFWKLS